MRARSILLLSAMALLGCHQGTAPVAAEGKQLAIRTPHGCNFIEISVGDKFRLFALDIVEEDARPLCAAEVSGTVPLEGVAIDNDGFRLLRYRRAVRASFRLSYRRLPRAG